MLRNFLQNRLRFLIVVAILLRGFLPAYAQNTADYVPAVSMHFLDNQIVEISNPKFKGKFKILPKQLGAGGFGEVLVAESVTAPKRVIALKVFFTERADKLTLAESSHVIAYRDVEIAFGDRTPTNVLMYSQPSSIVNDLGKEFIGVYSDLMEGDLKSQFPKLNLNFDSDHPTTIENKLSENNKILESMLTSLKEMHDAGLVHNDLKPGNILFKDGVYKTADFDGVTVIGSEVSASRASYYTVEYAAPERIPPTTTKVSSPVSDSFSVGASLFEMLFGKSPLRSLLSEANPDNSTAIAKAAKTFIETAYKNKTEFVKLTNHIKEKFKYARERTKTDAAQKRLEFFEAFILGATSFDPADRIAALDKLANDHETLKPYVASVRENFGGSRRAEFERKFQLNHNPCSQSNAETKVRGTGLTTTAVYP